MATLTVQDMTSLSEITPSYASADVAGDTFVYDDASYIHIKNGDASPHTMTLVTVRESNYGQTPDVDVVVAAGTERKIFLGPDTLRFRAADGLMDVTYDAVTSVTIGVFRLVK